MLPGYTDSFGKLASVNIWLSSPTSLSLHKRFRRRLHPDLHRQLRPEMLDDIQAHYSTLYQLGSNTGASFQTMRDLLSAAFSTHSALLLPTTLRLRQRAFLFQGTETPRPGYAQTTASVTKHYDTTTSPTSTCSELEGSAWHMVATLGCAAS